MSDPFDVRKSARPFDQTHTLVAVIELSQARWLVGGMVPGLKRSPLKKLEPKKEKLLKLLVRWRDEALGTGHEIERIAVACESGRDGFWLVREVLSREPRDRRAVARYAGLTGSPDESGTKRREKGLSKAGNARVRRGMIQLAWRLLRFQKDSALVQWYRARTSDGRGDTRKTMIVALARKLLIALWRLVTLGEVPEGFIPRPALQEFGDGRKHTGLPDRPRACHGLRTIRGGGNPDNPTALMPLIRLGPPTWSFAVSRRGDARRATRHGEARAKDHKAWHSGPCVPCLARHGSPCAHCRCPRP